MIRIVVARKHRDIYTARLEDGTHLCDSKRPFFDSARVILAMGHRPDELLVMRHHGDIHDSLSAPLSWAAKSTVRENSEHGPRIVRWDAYPESTGS